MMKKLFTLLFVGALLSGCGQIGQQSENPPIDEPNHNEKVVNAEQTLESFGTSVDIHQSGDAILFDLALANNSEEEAIATFSTSQQYEIVVTNEENEEVYRYSEDKDFTQALKEVSIAPDEVKSWNEQWTPESLESGTYEATVTIKVNQLNGERVPTGAFTMEKTFSYDEPGTAFRNIQVEGSNGNYKITGEARVFEGEFFYSVEEGHDYLVDETLVKVDQGGPNWSEFEITLSIPEEQLPVDGTLALVLYEVSDKDGSIMNVKSVKIDQIKKDVE
ncbi:BsuPI-related putative proteinase inhibitor [Bacillus solimangrovi]|uniref:Intracellular proteinase inhibitor BsuPI domain-containing protein n=1 Tax=Bacillus solimangrovi TaxID=1305675 RepID=A0A1E5LC34_9BACI|nr:BsuPI-related putative proteinase inhibitor [Bacillus solimangrovi]OEH91652.1 hypothetical protein BFG57_04580 [Bacillus solimangrovi]